MPHSITNEVVADQLLRAKAGERNLLTSSRTLQDWYARRLAVQMGIETMNTPRLDHCSSRRSFPATFGPPVKISGAGRVPGARPW